MFLVSISGLLAASFAGATSAQCMCFPGDACWPAKSVWEDFNATVGGRLISNKPLAASCHDPEYDEQKCANLRQQWLLGGVHMRSSSSIMAPLFANQSCDPFTERDAPCTLGNYAVYTLNASSGEDILATFAFAKEHDIRTVVRNTGHDYLGRSTGAGAIAIWTHNMKNTDILDWEDEGYKGKAIRVEAGVQGFEVLAAVKEENLVVVTGECPTVGVVGGYLQGGGHSGLSTSFGLAADNALSFEVVTTPGQIISTSRHINQDLYWALAGGGGGTFGVVISATLKALPDAPVAGASFSLALPDGSDPDMMYNAIDIWHAEISRLVDAGVMVIYFFGEGFLQVPALTAYNKTVEQLQTAFQPVKDRLAKIGIQFNPTVTSSLSYHDHYEKYWGPLPEGNIQVGTMLFGGRLIPRSVVATTEFASAAKQLAQLGVTFIGVGTNVSRFGGHDTNAVLPQWRSSIVQASLILPWNFDAPWEDMLAAQRKITEEVQPVIQAATPGAGAYVNEADFQQPDWKETFYGENYGKLLAIKRKYDPHGLLYVVAGVGSDEREVGNDGRMCRVGYDIDASTESLHSEL